MPKNTIAIELIWRRIDEQNPGISEWLDGAVQKNEPEECWPYIRERRRKDEPGFRPRKNINYDGRHLEVAVGRLIIAREKGRVSEALDAAHLCLKNKLCCNPGHLVALSRGIRMQMDKTIEYEMKRMLEICPDGQIRMIVVPPEVIRNATGLPESWPTDEEILAEHPKLAEELHKATKNLGKADSYAEGQD